MLARCGQVGSGTVRWVRGGQVGARGRGKNSLQWLQISAALDHGGLLYRPHVTGRSERWEVPHTLPPGAALLGSGTTAHER